MRSNATHSFSTFFNLEKHPKDSEDVELMWSSRDLARPVAKGSAEVLAAQRGALRSAVPEEPFADRLAQGLGLVNLDQWCPRHEVRARLKCLNTFPTLRRVQKCI